MLPRMQMWWTAVSCLLACSGLLRLVAAQSTPSSLYSSLHSVGIPSQPLFWLSASTASASAAGQVSSWPSLTGGAGATPWSLCTLPYLATGSAALGSRAVVRFNGTACLALPSVLPLAGAGDWTFVLLLSTAANQPHDEYIVGSLNTPERAILVHPVSSTSQAAVFYSVQGSSVISSAAWPQQSSALSLLTVQFSQAQQLVAVQQNGVSGGSVFYPGAVDATLGLAEGYWQGSNFQGDVAEVLLFPSFLSAANVSYLQTQLIGFYAASNASPASSAASSTASSDASSPASTEPTTPISSALSPSSLSTLGISSSPLLWLSASNVTATSAGLVTTWPSQTGGVGGTVASPCVAPLLAVGSNGLPVVRFDGTSCLHLTTQLPTSDWTLLVVSYSGTQHVGDAYLVASTLTQERGVFVHTASGVQSGVFYSVQGGSVISSQAAPQAGNMSLLTVQFSASAQRVSLTQNGVAGGSVYYPGAVDRTLGLATGYYQGSNFVGDVAELLLFPSFLSSADVSTLQSQLTSVYGANAALPVATPASSTAAAAAQTAASSTGSAAPLVATGSITSLYSSLASVGIHSPPLFWLSASTVTASQTGQVSFWPSLTGGAGATPWSLCTLPYLATGSAALGSRAVVRFNGTACLALPSVLPLAGAGDWTFVLLLSTAANQPHDEYIVGSLNTPERAILVHPVSSTSQAAVFYSVQGSSVISSAAWPQQGGALSLVAVHFNAAQQLVTVTQNGVNGGSVYYPGAVDATLGLGQGYWQGSTLQGDVAEVLLFPSLLSSANISYLQTQLTALYTVTTTAQSSSATLTDSQWCLGLNDATACLSALFASLAGTVIVVPSHLQPVWQLSTTLDLPANTSLLGNNATFLMGNPAHGWYDNILCVGSNTLLLNVTFQSVVPSFGVCVENYATNVTLSHLSFLSTYGNGVTVGGYVSQLLVTDSYFYQLAYGVFLGQWYISQVTVQRCTFLNNSAEAVAINSPVITGQPFSYWSTDYVVRNVTIQGNTLVDIRSPLDSSMGFCISSAGGQYVLIQYNVLQGCQWQAIHLEDTTNHVTIQHNTIDTVWADSAVGWVNNLDGIWMANAQFITVHNNSFSHIPSSAIVVDGQPRQCTADLWEPSHVVGGLQVPLYYQTSHDIVITQNAFNGWGSDGGRNSYAVQVGSYPGQGDALQQLSGNAYNAAVNSNFIFCFCTVALTSSGQLLQSLQVTDVQPLATGNQCGVYLFSSQACLVPVQQC